MAAKIKLATSAEPNILNIEKWISETGLESSSAELTGIMSPSRPAFSQVISNASLCSPLRS